MIQNRADYLKEASSILGDKEVYITLERDPIEQFKRELLSILSEAKNANILDNQEFNFIYRIHPKTTIFYHIPKIHKDSVNPPGRPNVSRIDSVTSNLSVYVDWYLQPMVKSFQSYLKDTADTIKKFEGLKWKTDG